MNLSVLAHAFDPSTEAEAEGLLCVQGQPPSTPALGLQSLVPLAFSFNRGLDPFACAASTLWTDSACHHQETYSYSCFEIFLNRHRQSSLGINSGTIVSGLVTAFFSVQYSCQSFLPVVS